MVLEQLSGDKTWLGRCGVTLKDSPGEGLEAMQRTQPNGEIQNCCVVMGLRGDGSAEGTWSPNLRSSRRTQPCPWLERGHCP